MKHNCWGVLLLLLSSVMPQLCCAVLSLLAGSWTKLLCTYLQSRQQGGRSRQGAEESQWLPLEMIALHFLPQPFAVQLLPWWLTSQVWMVLPLHSAALCLQSMGGSFWKKMLSSQILYSSFCAGGRKWEVEERNKWEQNIRFFFFFNFFIFLILKILLNLASQQTWCYFFFFKLFRFLFSLPVWVSF